MHNSLALPTAEVSRPDIRVELLSGPDALGAEADEWARLACSSDLFVQHDWVRIWRQAFADPASFFILKATRGTEVVGYLPLLKYRSRWRLFPVTMLSFCANEHSTWGNLLLSPVRSPDVAQAIGRFLLEWGDWHVMLLPRMPLMSASSRYLLDSLLAVGSVVISRLEYQHVIEFPEDWDYYTASLSRNFRDNLLRTRRKLNKRGAWRIVIAPREMDLQTAFAGFVDVDLRSWKGHSGETIDSREDARLFYAGLVEAFGRGDKCWVVLLEVDGTVVSAGLFFEQDGVGYSLKTSSDASVEAGSMSLGHMGVLSGFEEAHRRGIRTMHTMSGAATWGRYNSVREPVVSACAYNNRRFYGRLVELTDRIATGLTRHRPGQGAASRKHRSGHGDSDGSV